MSSRRACRFFKPNKISSDCICTICSEVFFDAVSLPCEHILCEDCINKWSQKQNTCPLCRKSFKRSQLKPAKEMMQSIEELDVVCKFPHCDWKGPLKELKSHEENCTFSPEKTRKEVLELLPKYDKDGEDDIETPSISLVTVLFKKHPDIIQSILLKEKENTSPARSTLKKTRPSKKGSFDPLQSRIDAYFK